MLRREDIISRHDPLRLPALLAIVLVEVLMNTGAARVLYPLLAVSLLSPFAQKLWAAILIARVLLMSTVSWPPLNQLMLADFFIIRTLFVWIMVAQSKLLATNRAVQLLTKMLSPQRRALRSLLIAAAIGIGLFATFFSIAQPYVHVLFAVFLVFLATRIPGVRLGQSHRTRIGLAEIGLLIASAIVGLAICELAARLFVPPLPGFQGGIYRVHPSAVYCLAENTRFKHSSAEFCCTYTVSDQGLRDRHYPKKDPHTYRILCVGDSTTMGWGVAPHKTYAKVLEGLLAAHSLSKGVEVVNAGIANYGVWQELSLLEERGFDLEPDMVILQIHPQTDLRDALARVGKVMRSYDASWQRSQRNWRRQHRTDLTGLLCRHSRGFAFIYDRYAQGQGLLWRSLRPHFRVPVSNPPPEAERPWWLESSLRTYYPELEQGWRLVEESVRQIANGCREKEIRLVVFAMPAKHEVYPEHFRDLMREFNLDPELYDLDRTSRLAEELCERQAIDFVRILERFREYHDGGDPLYYMTDGHLNSLGHIVCAQILHEHLMETYLRELVPASDDRTEG